MKGEKVKHKGHKVVKWIGLVLLITVMVLGLGVTVWVKVSTYGPDETAKALMKSGGVSETGDAWRVDPVDETGAVDTGRSVGTVVFYQGGFVDTAAYLPLAKRLSEGGLTVFLPKMPLNLAILNVKALDKIRARYPSEGPWYVGGHSLGGTSAIMHLANTKINGQIDGLFLLGSYGTEAADLRGVTYPVVSIVASEDGVLNFEAFETGKATLPENTVYKEIVGGNHGGFGNYGNQKGDGLASITSEEQQEEVVELIMDALGIPTYD